MKKIFLTSIIFFVCGHKYSLACMLWNNRCKVKTDCYTGNCDRRAHWEFEVCRPANGNNGGSAGNNEDTTCKPLWYNKCTSNSDCCSNFCAREKSSWQYGVCKAILPGNELENTGNNTGNPMCGVAISNSARQIRAIFNGQYTKRGEFPWHVGIYQKFGSSWQQICGGTLISRRVVISAAHCFDEVDEVNQKLYMKHPTLFRVGLGKYYRALNVHERMAQIIEVQKIQFSPQYRGKMDYYGNDIAFVTLKSEAEYTNAVRPVCIDVDSVVFENEQLKDGAVGKIVGWGLTEQNKSSETILVAKMPFVPMDECKKQSKLDYLKRDKLCAGDYNSNVKVCPGDSGGGLVFEDSRTGKYYLRGVVSLGPDPCGSRGLSKFTKVSAHKDLVERYLKL